MIRASLKSLPEEDVCILVNIDNHPHSYLCECGDASLLTVKEIINCQAIFISHTHIDHFSNIDSVFRHQIGSQKTVTIVGPKDIAEHVQARLRSYTWNLVSENAITYDIKEVLPDEIVTYRLKPPLWELQKISSTEWKDAIIYESQAFAVKGVLLDHKTAVLAYKFVEKERLKIDLKGAGLAPGKWIRDLKVAFENQQEDLSIQIGDQNLLAKDLFDLLTIQKGDSLGIIMDHAPHTQNHELILGTFDQCRKVLIESFYKNEDQELAVKNFHSYAQKSAQILRQCCVKDPIPVHFSRKYNSEEINELRAEFFNVF